MGKIDKDPITPTTTFAWKVTPCTGSSAHTPVLKSSLSPSSAGHEMSEVSTVLQEPLPRSTEETIWDKTKKTNRETSSNTKKESCPEGYTKWQGTYYKAFGTLVNFEESMRRCYIDGGTLAMPRDNDTNNFLISLTKPFDYKSFWFGLHDRVKEGTFEWIDGTALGSFNSWRHGEPNDHNSKEDCAGYFLESKWNDFDCNCLNFFICQVAPEPENLGCWADKSDRAIPIRLGMTDPLSHDDYNFRSDPIQKCHQVALGRGFTVFAVQNGGECFGSVDAQNTYNEYGPSTACATDGEGGPWANEVYKIAEAENRPYTSLGCWADKSDRAIPILEKTDPLLNDNYYYRSDPIQKCHQVALGRGFTVFAVQNGGECFGSVDAQNTYNEYGPSTACARDGKGGPWANELPPTQGDLLRSAAKELAPVQRGQRDQKKPMLAKLLDGL
ncbi:hypothetical protein Bbelb_361760 [Branchiostoma belcheri]|nr:hypothetical protein Bbelb_361760 [Branchiostoma belcheri]